ncbi:MmcQ/YjbR family DNA-binding protein [Mucilaginibacter rigui]|uniref:MmcQ/YjbR family DNA-binding protein n=1 Tax=Mucilaginibacter rigui TaxID=534635 RepID=A0ABR7X1G7_9SPHI|nr:MmcQ/YjbR family DNA-binding protein [Mucilaginibacter rigui]MBD1384443.1 MmcQ/YjbR family DNA-binding protein [Mucilaginibacter rigui]
MIDIETLRGIALSLPQATEGPHADKTGFRIGKKLFATVNIKESRATVKLSPANQDIFCTFDSTVIYPVPNKWGKQGWTHVNLQAVHKEMLTEILKVAYCEVAPKRLAELVVFE